MPSASELSVSNIAFPADRLDESLALLTAIDIRAVEIAPHHVFGRWQVPDREVDGFRQRLADAGLRCVALQGIVFNAGEAHLFASETTRELLYEHLVEVARMAGRLGAAACVFGAPRLRDPGDLEPAHARAIAVEFLRRAGRAFAAEGTALSFEPNAAQYGCKFIRTTREAIDLVNEVDTPGIGLQIDTGTVFLEQEAPDILVEAARHAAHAHISEPDLAPVGSTDVDHAAISRALDTSGYSGSISIEMRATDAWAADVRRAVAFVRDVYWR